MKFLRVPTDAVIVTGDLTNYGDDASVEDFFRILTESSKAKNAIITMGNHDIGHTEDLGMTNQQARDRFIRMHNEYLGTDFDKPYYSSPPSTANNSSLSATRARTGGIHMRSMTSR